MTNKVVKQLSAETLPDLARLLARSFCHYEPITIPLKCDEAKYTEWAGAVAAASLDGGLSCVVYDAENSKLLGGLVAQISATEQDLEHVYPALHPVYELLGLLQMPAYVKEVDPYKVLHFFMVGALPLAEGGQKGITETCCRYMIKSAKDKGFRYITAELTGPVTQHVCLDKCGFKTVQELVYVTSGVPAYKDLAGKVVLAVLDLDN